MSELSEYTSFRVGGPAQKIVAAANEAEIIQAVKDADEVGLPVLVLGRGTNVLIGDKGFDGVVIKISSAHVESEVDACSGATLTISAGEDWDEFVASTILHGYAGLETLSGIPGTVGAAPIQNIGAYGHEVSEFITRVRTYDRHDKQVRTFTNQECDFSYRNSRFKTERDRYVVLSVQFQLRIGEMTTPITYTELATALGISLGEKAPVKRAREEVLKLRGSKGMLLNPTDHDSWSAGSFFTNPILTAEQAAALPAAAPRWVQEDGRVKTSAAWLMEHAGVQKGDQHQGARISSKHVLALTNSGNATAADIAALAREAKDKVLQQFGITLIPEVNLVGLTLD
ncbi:MAG: UDP-N-acetylmuramate dehydrogenase [Actinobacteria bacterium]|nr:UDP-N-acetylmuramate dehydrogenase [Actinomycetota bacterium]